MSKPSSPLAHNRHRWTLEMTELRRVDGTAVRFRPIGMSDKAWVQDALRLVPVGAVMALSPAFGRGAALMAGKKVVAPAPKPVRKSAPVLSNAKLSPDGKFLVANWPSSQTSIQRWLERVEWDEKRLQACVADLRVDARLRTLGMGFVVGINTPAKNLVEVLPGRFYGFMRRGK